MSRYVDVEPLDVVGTKGVNKDYVDGMAYVLDLLDNLPAADVEPVRHGRWDNMFDGKFTGGAYWYRCSNCGRIVPDVRNGGWNYCPDCGARMGGEEQENEN